jgi:hypothetical protein
MPNIISATLTTVDKNNIKNNIEAIRLIVTFLKNLTPRERKKLYKMGQKSMGFVKNTLSAMKANPSAVPASFSVSEFEKDLQLYLDLMDVASQLGPLWEGVQDTMILLGSELMKQARLGYKLIREASKGDLALDTTAKELGIRFKRSARSSPAVHTLQSKQTMTLHNVVPKRLFKALSNTSLTLYRGEAAIGKGTVVDPNSKFFIPTGWTTITIVNNHATAQAIFSLIQK